MAGSTASLGPGINATSGEIARLEMMNTMTSVMSLSAWPATTSATSPMDSAIGPPALAR